MSYAMETIGQSPFSSERGVKHGVQNANDEAELERLRGLARTEKNRQHDLAAQSQAAYQAGDGGEASQLSQESKRHAAQADAYNKQASEFIFRANNAQQADDTIDLHGLYVEEAEHILQVRINAARQSGAKGLHVIVGKGIHSVNHVQKIKPAVERLCQEQNLEFSTEANEGRMYISFDAPGSGEVPSSNHNYAYAGYQGGGGGQHQQQQQQHYGGQQQQHQNQNYGGQQQHQNQNYGGQQQQQQDPNAELKAEAITFAKQNAPKFFRKLRQCCVVM